MQRLSVGVKSFLAHCNRSVILAVSNVLRQKAKVAKVYIPEHHLEIYMVPSSSAAKRALNVTLLRFALFSSHLSQHLTCSSFSSAEP